MCVTSLSSALRVLLLLPLLLLPLLEYLLPLLTTTFFFSPSTCFALPHCHFLCHSNNNNLPIHLSFINLSSFAPNLNPTLLPYHPITLSILLFSTWKATRVEIGWCWHSLLPFPFDQKTILTLLPPQNTTLLSDYDRHFHCLTRYIYPSLAFPKCPFADHSLDGQKPATAGLLACHSSFSSPNHKKYHTTFFFRIDIFSAFPHFQRLYLVTLNYYPTVPLTSLSCYQNFDHTPPHQCYLHLSLHNSTPLPIPMQLHLLNNALPPHITRHPQSLFLFLLYRTPSHEK